MTGITNFNFEMFDRAKLTLETLNYDVVSPADLDRALGWVEEYDGRVTTTVTFDLDTAVKVCCKHVANCDAIALLPGWQHSYGAKMELQVALENNLSVIVLSPDLAIVS
jgi:Domain of unknown function (DUF4406)